MTDYSNAARTMLFDIHNLRWDEKLCAELNIPIEKVTKSGGNSYVNVSRTKEEV